MPLTIPAETRTIVENVRWETYVSLSEDRLGSVPRLTYDRGLLELMNPRKDHEVTKTLLGRLVVAFAEEAAIDLLSVASTTFRREDLDRGFEADESFYFEHAEAIRVQDEIDLSVDPAPELVNKKRGQDSLFRIRSLLNSLACPDPSEPTKRMVSTML